jgi:hypothetical protein
VARALSAHPGKLGVSHLDYIGMNHTGWCDVACREEPMHQISLRYEAAVEHMEQVQRVCVVRATGGLEPEDLSVLVRLPYVGKRPSVHVNHSRHFTSHPDCYARDSGGKTVHPYWGDFRRYYPHGEEQAS